MKNNYLRDWKFQKAFLGLIMMFLPVELFAYTAPTALRVLWVETGGTDQTATCHDYGDYITNVTFAGINNTTAGSGAKAWHTDFGRTTPQITPGEVTIGQSYSFSVTVTGTDFSFHYVAVYIDWNKNNTNGTSSPYALDSNENPLVWYGYTGSGSKTLTGTITVPSGASTGQLYMRVMLDADSGGSTGGDFTCGIGYGEFQDYVLNVSAAPTITGISPSSGVTSGGTSVTITGTNFTGATAVTFGGTAASYTVNSATQITATSPAKSAGTVDITVTTAGGTSATGSADQFTYLTPGTFTGATSSNWATATNWAGGSVPTSSTDVTIPSGKTAVIGATTTADCKNLSVVGSLTIQSSSSGTGSLIVSGTPTGNVSCERYLTGNAWHVVSPIASGGSISAFIQAAGNAVATSGSNYGMMDYNETGNSWNSFFTSAVAGNLAAGKGYSLRRSADGVVTFTGTLTAGSKSVTLTKGGADGWNCVGNPYSSAINMNTAAGGSGNFLATNSGSLDASYACIYVWDGASSYKILGNVSYSGRDLGQNLLQPGQGFFVKAAAAGSITFNTNMQAHQTGGGFKSSGVSWPGFELTATAGAVSASTVVAFNSAMTRGLDPTYDAGLLRGTSGLSLYSRLLDDNGVDFAIQCLPESDKIQVIPVGLDSQAGGEISFSAEATGLPANYSLIIEDKLNGSFTPLEKGQTYKVAVTAGAKGIGRFYLHAGIGAALDLRPIPDGQLNLKAYPANGEIVIEGQVGNQAQALLFDAGGRKLGQFLLQQGNRNTLPAAGLTRGIYMLKVTDGSDRFSTKIVIL